MITIKVGTGIMKKATFAKLSGIPTSSIDGQVRKGLINLVKTGETKQGATYVNCLDFAIKLAKEAIGKNKGEDIVIEVANVEDKEDIFKLIKVENKSNKDK